MLRQILIATVAVAALSGAASAADLPSRKAPVAYAPVAMAYSWTGLYVGAQVGYTWNNNSIVDRITGTLLAQTNPDKDGAFGGLHAGYNWQAGSMVYGLEGDVNYANLKGNDILRDAAGIVRAPNNHSARLGVNGSVRGRLGIAFGNILPYITGGVAIGDNRYTINHIGGQGSFSKTMIGWTLGAGVEYALNTNWSIRGEYRYTDYGSAKARPLAGFPNEEFTGKTKTNDVRLGLTYKFGGPSAIVAKY